MLYKGYEDILKQLVHRAVQKSSQQETPAALKVKSSDARFDTRSLFPLPRRDRNHLKPQVRTSEVTSASITPVPLESLTGLRSPQPPAAASNAAAGSVQTAADLTAAFSHLSSSLEHSDDNGMAGRGR